MIDRNCLNLIRQEKVTVKYKDANGIEKIENVLIINSRIVQYEMDHLNGLDMYSNQIYEHIKINELESNSKILDYCINKQMERNFLLI